MFASEWYNGGGGQALTYILSVESIMMCKVIIIALLQISGTFTVPMQAYTGKLWVMAQKS